jgi:hypothetical protein
MGIGDWGLGIGDWAQSPIPNPQSPLLIILLKIFHSICLESSIFIFIFLVKYIFIIIYF